jgi:recombination protein RecA
MVNKDAGKDKDLKKREESSNRLKALELALSQIEKQFGKGSIMKLGEDVKADVDVIPTGSISLDWL